MIEFTNNNLHVKKMMRACACCLLSSIFWTSCFTTKAGKITGTKVTQTFPYINENGKLMRYDTLTTEIYHYLDQTIYHSSYNFFSSPKDIIMTRPDEVRHYLFVFSKNEKYGLLFDKYRSKAGKKVLVDSMLSKEWSNSIEIYTNFENSHITQTDERANHRSGTIEKFYNFKMKNDSTFTGSLFFRFTKSLTDLPYSFSRVLDSLNKMKLSKVKIANNSRYVKDYEITLDRVEQEYTLDEIVISNRNELLKYFEKDRKENLLRK